MVKCDSSIKCHGSVILDKEYSQTYLIGEANDMAILDKEYSQTYLIGEANGMAILDKEYSQTYLNGEANVRYGDYVNSLLNSENINLTYALQMF